MKAVRFKIWVESDGDLFLGNGRVKLLQAIHEKGSISGAAKSMTLSYKKAWEQIDHMNALSETPLVETSSGGAGGGGARLTPLALQLIEKFNKVSSSCSNLLTELGDDISFEKT